MFVKQRQYFLLLFLLVLPIQLYAQTVSEVDRPDCLDVAVKDATSAKCIASYYGRFIAQFAAFGHTWDVEVQLKGGYWYVYPKEPSASVPEGTILFIIDAQSGQLIGGFRPNRQE